MDQIKKICQDKTPQYDLFNHETLTLILKKIDKREEEVRVAMERYEALEKHHTKLMDAVVSLLGKLHDVPSQLAKHAHMETPQSSPTSLISPNPPTIQNHQPPITPPASILMIGSSSVECHLIGNHGLHFRSRKMNNS